MSSEFINLVNLVAESETNETEVAYCKETIDHYLFYQFTLIPAIVITLALASTKKRRAFLLNVFNGRPALIFPMDSLTRMSRLSYACAFGATAYLVYQIVVSQTYAIQVNNYGAPLTSFVAICSMFIYGMVFFPLFSSLALSSVFSLSLGALYVWMLMTVEIYRLFDCSTSLRGRILLLLRELPSLVCLGFLSISIPIRLIKAARQRKYFFQDDDRNKTYSLQEIRHSYVGHHVLKLFRKPKIKQRPQVRGIARIKGMLLSLAHNAVYKRKKGFLYPARIISVMFVSALIVYMLSLELLAIIPPLIDQLLFGGIQQLLLMFLSEVSEELVAVIRDYVNIIMLCFVVSTVLAAVFVIFNILHSLSNYRANLLALYRGDRSCISSLSDRSNTSYCVNSIKYAGFQVGYIVWGFLLHCIVLWLIAMVCSFLIKFDVSGVFSFLFRLLWPIVLTVVIVSVGQFLLAKYVFLQENGQVLALNNRSSYFNFTYFMFFYNIFMSLFSTFLRIVKAIFIGLVFFGRLDNSSLPRRFESLDPGFQAYVGFMQMEAAHTHPVVIVFTHIILLGLHSKKDRDAQDVKAVNESDDLYLDKQQKRRSAAARFSWHVAYTLLHNPDLRLMRKGHIHILRQARLLGVAIPISDRQADIDLQVLQKAIAETKKALLQTSKVDTTTSDEIHDTDDAELKKLIVQEGECQKGLAQNLPEKCTEKLDTASFV